MTVLWQPHPDRSTRLQAFQATLPQAFADYRALHRWSVTYAETFWTRVWQFCGLQGSGQLEPACERGATLEQDRWFPAQRLNHAENLLRHHRLRPDGIALVAVDERGERRTWSWRALHDACGRLAAHLQALGVQPGDRVAGWLPNSDWTVIAALATSWVGAVWSSCSPDFGVEAVCDRFGQIQPRLLLVAGQVQYGGRSLDLSERVSRLRLALGDLPCIQIPGGPALDGCLRWQDLMAEAVPALPPFVQRAFNDPLCILYSSGTTGRPKCIVHGIGGTLLQHAKEHALHGDLSEQDVLCYYTTCGWMMWNWLLGGLQTGARLVLYDGHPGWPDSGRLFRLVEQEGITHLGTSAKFLQAVEKSGLVPRERYRLDSLRVLYSTGSPLLEDGYRFVYEQVRSEVQLSSISGGTDIISCFALGCADLPVHLGELQCLGLGMDVDVVDDQGRSLPHGTGELVCRSSFPSMPVGFWNDAEGERYHEAYFARFPGLWAHGDFAERRPHTGHDGLVIHGRSDAVLNPGGVRIGTAEIYRQVEGIAEIRESIVIGQQWDGDVRVVLFVVMQPGRELTDALRDRLRQRIRTGASPRHVPAVILEVPDIPRTLSGKIVELAVRDVVHGRSPGNLSALANPDALEHFRDRPELST